MAIKRDETGWDHRFHLVNPRGALFCGGDINAGNIHYGAPRLDHEWFLVTRTDYCPQCVGGFIESKNRRHVMDDYEGLMLCGAKSANTGPLDFTGIDGIERCLEECDRKKDFCQECLRLGELRRDF